MILAFIFCERTAKLKLQFFAFDKIKWFGAFERTLIGISFYAIDALKTEIFLTLAFAEVRLLCDVIANCTLIFFGFFIRLYEHFGF